MSLPLRRQLASWRTLVTVYRSSPAHVVRSGARLGDLVTAATLSGGGHALVCNTCYKICYTGTMTDKRRTDPAAADAPLSLEDSLGFRLSRVVRVRREHWATQLRVVGVTPPQAAILRTVRDHHGQSLRALARVLNSDAMSVKRCVDELESRGLLLTSTSDEDRRIRRADLTRRGASVVRRIDALAATQEARIVAPLSASQRAVLDAVLDIWESVEGLAVNDAVDSPDEQHTEKAG